MREIAALTNHASPRRTRQPSTQLFAARRQYRFEFCLINAEAMDPRIIERPTRVMRPNRIG